MQCVVLYLRNLHICAVMGDARINVYPIIITVLFAATNGINISLINDSSSWIKYIQHILRHSRFAVIGKCIINNTNLFLKYVILWQLSLLLVGTYNKIYLRSHHTTCTIFQSAHLLHNFFTISFNFVVST